MKPIKYLVVPVSVAICSLGLSPAHADDSQLFGVPEATQHLVDQFADCVDNAVSGGVVDEEGVAIACSDEKLLLDQVLPELSGHIIQRALKWP